jgi:hypothetical protein
MADPLSRPNQTAEPSDPSIGDQDLARFVRQFDLSVDASRNSRLQAQIHRDYYDGKQWSDEELEKLHKRGQPAITDNRIKDKVEYLLGMERQTRTDPKAYPRTPDDDPGADAATDALRYIADCNHFQQVKSGTFENMCVEGFGGCEVIAEDDPKSKNKKIKLRYIRWDRLYFDAHSVLRDFSDSRYQGIVKWMDIDEAKASYPKLGDLFEWGMTQSGSFWAAETYDDTPRWFDRTRKRIQILEHYFKQGGDWYRVVFSRVGIIEAVAKSVYLDCETDKPECPIILQSLYVDREGNRYGVVKRYKDLQDEINKRRSKSLHLLSVNQALAERGAVDDVEAARQQLARPDGFLEYTPGMKIEVQKNVDLAEGQFKLLQEAMQSLSGTGPNQALLGNTGDISGRAKQLDQAGGAIQLGILSDSLRYWQNRVMRATWSRIKQFWTAEVWIRVTDDENTKFLALNSKYPEGHPQAGKPQNMVADLDVDIIIDEMPDVVSIQQEQFQTLAELAKAGLPIPPAVIIQASGLRNKQQIIDMINPPDPSGQDVPPQVKAAIQQKEQQLQQQSQQVQKIAQAQQQKTTEQQQQGQQLDAQHAQNQVEAANIKVATANLSAQQAKLEAQQAIAQANTDAQTARAEANQARLDSLESASKLADAHAQLGLIQAKTAKTIEETRILTELPQAQDKGNV